MDHREAGRYWEGNAAVWTRLSRAGWDVYRDHVNTPSFLDLLPEVAGQHGLDIGCGEGHNTRLVAELGARMTALDVAPTFLRFAHEAEHLRPLDIHYLEASGLELPFPAACFDFVMAVMSLMDMPRHEVALQESYRVLRAGGFLQFSILHPCFMPIHRRLLRDSKGIAYAVELGRYFEPIDGEIERWIFSAAPGEAKADCREFEVPRFHRTLAEWLNAVVDAGFVVERMAEPKADEETARRVPAVADTRVAPYFLQVRCRKP